MAADKVDYSAKIVKKICDMIETGESVSKICRMKGMPEKKSVYRWLAKYPEFMEEYMAAKICGVEALVDQMMDIANDSSMDFKEVNGKKTFDGDHVQRSRLRIDTIKWVSTKLVPRLYGDRTQVDVSGEVGVKALSDDQLKMKIVSLQKQMRIEAKALEGDFKDVTPK